MKKIQLDKRNIKGSVDKQELLYHITRYYFVCQFLKKKDYVLDCASGVGYGTYLLSQSFPQTSFVGVDIDKKTVVYAKKHFIKDNIVFKNVSLEQFSTKKFFDIIVSFETIEHVDDARKFINKCYHLLKPGGVLIISSPNKQVMSPHTNKPLTRFHVKEFNKDEFTDLLNRHFTSIQLYGQRHDFSPIIITLRRWSAGVIKRFSNDQFTRRYLDIFRFMNIMLQKHTLIKVDKKLTALFIKKLTQLAMYPIKINKKSSSDSYLFLLAVCQKMNSSST